jgi:hypothetical protein
VAFRFVRDRAGEQHCVFQEAPTPSGLLTAIGAPANENAGPAAPIARRERLGGILSYYYRPAASPRCTPCSPASPMIGAP